ncbi:MAG: high-potential iron-sulfur protein [Pseudomonadota bacterium]
MDARHCQRRRMLKQGAVALASLATMPLAGLQRDAVAGASRVDLYYQDHPKDGQRCADCAAFLPPADANSSLGACRVVAGQIDRNGWCMAFSKK